MKKVRGFEKISQNQWDIDYSEQEIGQNFELIKNSILYEDIKLPKRMTANSAGYDVFSPVSLTLKPGKSIKIPTGFKAYMKNNERLLFFPRSGQGFKYFIRLANTIGVGESDYYDCERNEGHYWVKIRNEGNIDFTLKMGEAFAQCSFDEFLLADGDEYGVGDERIGGLGSTTK